MIFKVVLNQNGLNAKSWIHGEDLIPVKNKNVIPLINGQGLPSLAVI